MNFAREPRLQPTPILDLRPTQITVGMREVEAKRAEWRAQGGSEQAAFLGRHLIPVILGPGREPYLIDHHHLARALYDEGVKEVATTLVADLSRLKPSAFWVYLDNRAWMHAYDQHGKRRSRKQLPKNVEGLIDDPFRSLAGALRLAGGYAKDAAPFSEFLWADFLRRRMKKKSVKHFGEALEEALRLAKSAAADYLPGWCGPVS